VAHLEKNAAHSWLEEGEEDEGQGERQSGEESAGRASYRSSVTVTGPVTSGHAPPSVTGGPHIISPHLDDPFTTAMADPPWQDQLRLRLLERNARESSYASVIEQCTVKNTRPNHPSGNRLINLDSSRPAKTDG